MLTNEIEEFRAMIARLVEQLEEISSVAKAIPEITVDELAHKFTLLAEEIDEADHQMSRAKDQLEEIRNRWGR